MVPEPGAESKEWPVPVGLVGWPGPPTRFPCSVLGAAWAWEGRDRQRSWVPQRLRRVASAGQCPGGQRGAEVVALSCLVSGGSRRQGGSVALGGDPDPACLLILPSWSYGGNVLSYCRASRVDRRLLRCSLLWGHPVFRKQFKTVES